MSRTCTVTGKLRDWVEITAHLEVAGFEGSCAKGCGIMEPLPKVLPYAVLHVWFVLKAEYKGA